MLREAVGIKLPPPKMEGRERRGVAQEAFGSFFKNAYRTFQTRRIDLLGRDIASYEAAEPVESPGLRISKKSSGATRGGLLHVVLERDYEWQGMTKVTTITIGRDPLMNEFSYVQVSESKYSDHATELEQEDQILFDSRHEVNELPLSTIVHDLQLADKALRS